MASMATARAPGRVNLIGEHTDYNAGLCLPYALGCATTVTVRRRSDRQVRLVSTATGSWDGDLDSCRPGGVTGWAAYPAGVLWALARTGREVPGIDVEIDSTVPVGAGLSSSASLEAAVAVAVTALLEERLDDRLRRELVAVCRAAETEVVGAPTGGLDQHAVLQSPDAGAVLIDFRDGATLDVPLPIGDDGIRLLVIDTAVAHAHVDGGYAARRADCEAAALALGVRSLREASAEAVALLSEDRLRRRARHVSTENDRVSAAVEAIGSRDWAHLGMLLDASHASLRDDFEVSCPELDLAVTLALEAGALGARMTGGGFGGSAVVLVEADRAQAVRGAVDAGFACAGLTAPTHLDGAPAQPAGLLDVRA